MNPALFIAVNLKEIIFSEMNRHDEALEAYEKALMIDPDFAGAWYNKGLALGELNRTEASIQTFKKVLEIDKSYTGAWYNMACLYSRSNLRAQSLTNLRTAIAYNPSCKETARGDEDFRNLWDDAEFILLTKE